jgi:hypothetical protein
MTKRAPKTTQSSKIGALMDAIRAIHHTTAMMIGIAIGHLEGMSEEIEETTRTTTNTNEGRDPAAMKQETSETIEKKTTIDVSGKTVTKTEETISKEMIGTGTTMRGDIENVTIGILATATTTEIGRMIAETTSNMIKIDGEITKDHLQGRVSMKIARR